MVRLYNECKIVIQSIDSTSDSTDFFSFESIEPSPRFESIDTTETRFESIVLESPESLSPNSKKSITETFPPKNKNNTSCLIICCNMILILVYEETKYTNRNGSCCSFC